MYKRQVVASASEKGCVVTNGMSYHARSGKNANAAVVVSVGGKDFGDDPRRAIAFQRELEARAYAAGRSAGEYAAPAENIQSFLEERGQLNIGRVQPTYDRGVTAADLGALLPGELADTLRAGPVSYTHLNPEIFEALKLGLDLATKTGADLMLATDPDADRVGIAMKCPDGSYELVSGNEMGALLLDYILSLIHI